MERISPEVRKQNEETSRFYRDRKKWMLSSLTSSKQKIRKFHLIEDEVYNKVMKLQNVVNGLLSPSQIK